MYVYNILYILILCSMLYMYISCYACIYNIIHVYSILFEGVCVTTVILAPGACGRWAPSRVLDTTSVAPVAPVAPRGVFQKRRYDRYTRDFVAHEVPSFKNFWKAATRDPKAPQGQPKGAQGRPRAPQGIPE